MKTIGILSDTHSCWDDRFYVYFKGCDEIWHAGDIGDISIAERLSTIAPLRAVCGNIDHGIVRRTFKELEIFDIERIKVLLTHIGGYPGKWSRGIKSLLRDNDIRLIVDGHSHILKIMYDSDLQCLHINPGAAGHHGWQRKRTFVTIVLDEGNMRDCKVIELR